MKILSQYFDFKVIFAVSTLLLPVSFPAFAQDGAVPVYTPTSAWLVGPASLGEMPKSAGNMPCVVANQFGNGFVLRLSGGGGQLMAMAIDFNQKAFEPRRKYEVEFSVPGQFFRAFQGAAYDRQTLLFGLQKAPEFYEALKVADQLVITVAEASVALSLVGLGDGFHRMESCYTPGAPMDVRADAKMAQPVQAPPAARKSPQNPLIAREAGLTPMPGDDAMVTPADARQASIPSPDPQLSVNAVLNDVAPVPPSVKGGSAGFLIAKAQEAEEAARRLSAKSPARSGAEGLALAQNRAAPQVVRPNGAEIMAGATAPAKSASQTMRWRALKGADLEGALKLWTEGAGVGLMWLADTSFPIPRSLSLEGNFETALQALLEQYDGMSPRPVGRIYREPGSQALVLVIERR